MDLKGKKLGILIAGPPGSKGFVHAVGIARAALNKQIDVYVYCIDQAVSGVDSEEIQSLRTGGVKLYACAYGAHKRNIPLSEMAVFAGLTVVSDLIASTDRFLSFT